MNALPAVSPSLPGTLAALNGETLTLIAMVLGSCLMFYAIYSIQEIVQTRAREATRREIAAYVAEGSIGADDAAKLMATEPSHAEATIADAVAWGTISPGKAESLIRSMRTPSGEKAAAAKA